MVIVSGDRDVFQLVADDVTMVYPVRGVSDVWRMDPSAVRERYLVPPERYSDLAALVGESSDNLPGVPGVGPKTAAKWITTYGDLAGIVANVDKITGKVGDALREHLDGVLRNRRLNQLVRDVPGFTDTLTRAVQGAQDGLLMTIGITPTHPETGQSVAGVRNGSSLPLSASQARKVTTRRV